MYTLILEFLFLANQTGHIHKYIGLYLWLKLLIQNGITAVRS